MPTDTAARIAGAKKKIVPGEEADEADVLAMTELLRRHFDELSIDTEPPAMTSQAVDESLAAMKVFEEGGDLGVQAFWSKTAEELHRLLDFPEGRPVLWNKFRAKDSAVTAWDEAENDKTRVDYEKGSERMRPQPLSLFPHQLQAIASCIAMIFDDLRQKDKGGMLIADGVGLGKSATLFGVVAFLAQLYEWQQAGREARAKAEAEGLAPPGPRVPLATIFATGE